MWGGIGGGDLCTGTSVPLLDTSSNIAQPLLAVVLDLIPACWLSKGSAGGLGYHQKRVLLLVGPGREDGVEVKGDQDAFYEALRWQSWEYLAPGYQARLLGGAVLDTRASLPCLHFQTRQPQQLPRLGICRRFARACRRSWWTKHEVARWLASAAVDMTARDRYTTRQLFFNQVFTLPLCLHASRATEILNEQ